MKTVSIINKGFFLIALMIFTFSCNNKNNTEEKTIPQSEIAEESIAETTETKEETGKLKLDKSLYPNGELKMEGNSLNGIKEGKWTSWYESGTIWSETHFENGKRNGSTATWYSNGRKRYEGFYKDDKESGKWTYWDENGNLIKEVNH